MAGERRKIGIVGYGVVGHGMARLFEPAFDVTKYDPGFGFPVHADKADVMGADLAVICVPTPSLPDGSADISAVEESVAFLDASLILIKSTVPPGTTDRLAAKYGKAIHFSPEHLVERDPRESPEGFLIVGGPRADKVIDLYQEVMPTSTRMLACTNVEAELAKYMANAWFATKVTFCNEFAGIAAAMGVSYHRLRELWLADPRVERDHTAVFATRPGFDGKCLPKDIAGIVAASGAAGYEAQFLRSVIAANERFRRGIA